MIHPHSSSHRHDLDARHGPAQACSSHHSDAHDHGHSHPELDDETRTHAAHFMDDPRRARRLLLAFALTALTLVAEAIGGWWSGSLALLADAGHMLVDALALLFAWLGAHYARRPADERRSFGYARLEVLIGYSNALAQFLLVAWIAVEAAMRFMSPSPILSGTMLAVAMGGLLINLLVLQTLGGHDHDDLNTASARLHVLGDLLGSIGAVTAALLVRYLDWLWTDPAISIFVSLLILVSAWRLLRRSAHILLEGVPDGLAVDVLASAVENAQAGVHEVHHVHVWQLAGGIRMATLHARLVSGADPDAAILAVGRLLRTRFGIEHATVQLDGITCAQTACDPTRGRQPEPGCTHSAGHSH